MSDEIQFSVDVPTAPPDKWPFFVLWLGFLSVSPSYELAKQVRTKGLSTDRLENLPQDFDRVLEVFDDFGDVSEIEFEDWWAERGSDLAASIGAKPRVTKVATLEHQSIDEAALLHSSSDFLFDQWVKQGMQDTLLLAIPVGLSKEEIRKQVSALIDTQPKATKTIRAYEPKYKIQDGRHDSQKLLQLLNLMSTRSLNPEAELWRIGAETNLSETYSPELDPNQEKVRGEGSYDKMMLASITSRALKQGRMISENAARGIFPSHKKCDHALALDYHLINRYFWPDD